MRSTTATLLAALLVATAACSGNDTVASNATDPGTSTQAVADPTDNSTADTAPPTTTAAAEPVTADCAGRSSRQCLLPWPNTALTAPADTPTGRLLALPADAMPVNADGVPIDVADQNRADGFSPGSAVLVDLPGVDPERSGLAPSTDIGASLDPDAPIVILDTVTRERIPYWAELDAQATDDGSRVLIVHPAVSYAEGHEHLVVVRDLVDSSGAAIEPPADWTGAENMAGLAPMLAEEQLADGALMAWTFPVASADSLSGRARAARSLADEMLAGAAPAFSVTTVRPSGATTTIEGTFEVPSVLSGDGAPGSTLLLGDDGSPQPNSDDPTYAANFLCVVSTSKQLPTVVYGHGLLGSRQEAEGLGTVTALGFANVCATDWIGMSSDDIGNVAAVLGDLGRFNEVADRMVQGLVNFHALGILVNAADGFAAAPEFALGAGSVLATDGAVFVGNSQGGILGGAASAISDQWTRVVLGVPAMNYSLLLTRSSDWPQFQTIFDSAYPDEVDRVLALQLVQLLWDRGENQGYVQHLVDDTFDGVPAKSVLLIEAFGDHQVANVATEALARTIGAVTQTDPIGAGRSLDAEPLWGIERYSGSAPAEGAVLSLWDFGTPPPPTVNLPPSEPEYGEDPHGAGSREPRVIQQAFTWLLADTFQPCDGPCTSDVLTG